MEQSCFSLTFSCQELRSVSIHRRSIWDSLVYLAVFGSVIAFSSYLTLVGRIGADRAAFASILFPIVALFISAAFEKYRLTLLSALGIACILIGNALVLLQKRGMNPEVGSRVLQPDS